MSRRPPRNIVISHVYSSANKGDAALTSVLIADLRRRFPEARLKILSLQPDSSGQFEGVPELPTFRHFVLQHHRRWRKRFYVAYMVPVTLWWAMCQRLMGWAPPLSAELRTVCEAYSAADLVVAVGGGYIRSRPGTHSRLTVPLLLHPLLFSFALGKPTVLYSQSVGPFARGYERALASYVLRRMTLVMVREDASQTFLEEVGVRRNVVRTIDSGFLLCSDCKTDVRQAYSIPGNKLLIGVTVRAWLEGESQAAYERAVAHSLDNMVHIFDARILFIPQVTASGDDDRDVSRRVHQLMHESHAAAIIEDELDHFHLKALCDELDVLLGTRFHSVIFSLTSFVPVLAIEYEHKTSGVMRDLKLENWVVKIESANSYELTKLLCDLIRGRGHYRAHLRQYVPPYVRRARKSIDLLAKSYFDFGGQNQKAVLHKHREADGV